MTNGHDPVLEIEGVSAGYGRIAVLHEITFSLWAGEVVAVIGANGAGKTTLVRTISGLLRPSAGTIRFAGVNIGGLETTGIVGIGISQVPEGRRLFSGLTVEENLRIGAFVRSHKSRIAISSDLDKVFQYFPRLRERSGQLAGTLSGGEQQMCAIGRALMAEPKLLIIDELSLGLAPMVVEDLLTVLEDVREAGTTILLVEQDAGVALGFSDRAIVLKTGRVATAGSSTELLGSQDLLNNYLGG
jgi:branched-chain amino acid transport system ATP-binding protein